MSKRITEAKVHEIHGSNNLSMYTYDEVLKANQFIKDYALSRLKTALGDVPKPIREYILLMARCHYGSVETDEFLIKIKCYPDWIVRSGDFAR